MERNWLDLLVDSGLTLVLILLASEWKQRGNGNIKNLFLDLFEWLKHDPGQRHAIGVHSSRNLQTPLRSRRNTTQFHKRSSRLSVTWWACYKTSQLLRCKRRGRRRSCQCHCCKQVRNGDWRKKANEFDEEEWLPTDLMIRAEGVCLPFIQGRREFQSGRALSSAVGLTPFVGSSFEHVVGRVATSCWSIQIDRANLSLHIPFTLHILNFPTNIAPRASIL